MLSSDASAVHVVVGADRVHWPGVIGVVNSIRANTKTPERLRLHLLTPLGDEAAFRSFLQCNGIQLKESSGVQVLGFDHKLVPILKVQTKLTNLESPLNFARFYMHLLFPSVHKVLCSRATQTLSLDVLGLACCSRTFTSLQYALATRHHHSHHHSQLAAHTACQLAPRMTYDDGVWHPWSVCWLS